MGHAVFLLNFYWTESDGTGLAWRVQSGSRARALGRGRTRCMPEETGQHWPGIAGLHGDCGHVGRRRLASSLVVISFYFWVALTLTFVL